MEIQYVLAKKRETYHFNSILIGALLLEFTKRASLDGMLLIGAAA
jgi:hypothetical protein